MRGLAVKRPARRRKQLIELEWRRARHRIGGGDLQATVRQMGKGSGFACGNLRLSEGTLIANGWRVDKDQQALALKIDRGVMIGSILGANIDRRIFW